MNHEMFACVVPGGEEPFMLADAAKLRSALRSARDVAELCALAVWYGTAHKSPALQAALLDIAATGLPMVREALVANASSSRASHRKVLGRVKEAPAKADANAVKGIFARFTLTQNGEKQ